MLADRPHLLTSGWGVRTGTVIAKAGVLVVAGNRVTSVSALAAAGNPALTRCHGDMQRALLEAGRATAY